MSQLEPLPPEAFTIDEIAMVAGVSPGEVQALLEERESAMAGRRFVSQDEAVGLVRHLRAIQRGAVPPRQIFAARRPPRAAGGPFAASGALHFVLFAAIIAIASLDVRSAPTEKQIQQPARLVFLSGAGLGGGGGGGGMRVPRPAPAAEIRGTSKLRSPVTVARKVERREPETRVETPPPAVVPTPAPDPVPQPPQPQPTPPVVAPVVTVPSGTTDRTGVLTDTAAAPSAGPGDGGGTGTGRGTGIGEGAGAGIGEGSTAGIGGGPYRPGAGIAPPGLLREIKPVYTEEGRTRGIEGEVVMEVVVRSDGTVGAVRILRGLGAGLNQRAMDAVKQWRFSPARRYGSPVDVLVEIAVEFRLR